MELCFCISVGTLNYICKKIRSGHLLWFDHEVLYDHFVKCCWLEHVVNIVWNLDIMSSL